MQELLDTLLNAAAADEPVVYTSLVETRGSTPQKAGAAMLVFPNGQQQGTLGGGCVEAEVKRRALQVASGGTPELLSFQLDRSYGWDDGLICGGRMTMLIDPAVRTSSREYFTTYRSLLAQGCTEAIVFDAEKAGLPAGSRLLFDHQGKFAAGASTLDEVALDHVRQHLKPLGDRPCPYVAAGVSYLTHLPRCRLLIVGAGHVGQKVAEYAAQVDFDVWILDDREEYCNSERFATAQRLIVGQLEETLSTLDTDASTFCIIVTRGHNHDEQALFHLARKPSRYLGMIGSRRKIKLIFADLLQQGIRQAELDRVHAPLGLDIGSQTVAEIAISIVAQLIQVRNLSEIQAAKGECSVA